MDLSVTCERSTGFCVHSDRPPWCSCSTASSRHLLPVRWDAKLYYPVSDQSVWKLWTLNEKSASGPFRRRGLHDMEPRSGWFLFSPSPIPSAALPRKLWAASGCLSVLTPHLLWNSTFGTSVSPKPKRHSFLKTPEKGGEIASTKWHQRNSFFVFRFKWIYIFLLLRHFKKNHICLNWRKIKKKSI